MRALRAFAPAAPAVTGPYVRRHRLARLPPLRFRFYVRAEEVACGESSEIRGTAVQPDPSLRVDFLDRRASRRPNDRLTALLGGGPGLVGLARRDDLTIAGLQPEPELARTILVDLELPGHHVSLERSVTPDDPAQYREMITLPSDASYEAVDLSR